MPKFPVELPRERVIKALEALGFRFVRQHGHITMSRPVPGGNFPITLPDHPKMLGSTVSGALNKAGITREEFLKAYQTA